MTGLEQLAVVAAGFGAGILTSTVGVASLLSFPTPEAIFQDRRRGVISTAGALIKTT
jgi:hypothetical protein